MGHTKEQPPEEVLYGARLLEIEVIKNGGNDRTGGFCRVKRSK